MSRERPPKPDPVPVDPDAIPDTVAGKDAWVCWRFKFDADRDEWTKIPVDVSTGGFASTTDPDTWASFATALAYHERGDTNTDGLGFVFSDEHTVFGVDLDDCRDPETGELDDWAGEIVDQLATYTEASPSGTGAHALGVGFKPDGGNRADVGAGHIEIYDERRYFTVTGARLERTPADVSQAHHELKEIHAEYVADDETDEPEGGSGADNPTPETRKSGSSDLSDGEIVEKAKEAENGDKFRRLWRGDTSGYESHSEADLALCSILAFWTGGDRRQIDSLFRDSGLYRDKWDRDDYRKRTIKKAVAKNSDTYEPGAGSEPAQTGTDRPADPEPPQSTEDSGADESGAETVDVSLTPGEVAAWAGLGEDEDVSDLTDREKAASVWEIVKRHDGVHVRVRRDNGSLWAYDGGIWKPEGERALRVAARRALGGMNYGDNVLSELKAQVRADPTREVERDQFGAPSGHVAVQNGLLELEAAADRDPDAARPLQPDDYALARLPVTYDADATADRWKEFVGEVVESDMIETVQEFIGYVLHRDGMPYNKALLLVGSGSNGKSTFLDVIRELYGTEQTTAKPVHNFDRDDHVADLYGSLANIDADLSEGSLSSEGVAMFKRLVGDDRIEARRLYEEPFEFKPTAKHLYACNQVPDVSAFVGDHDIAFWRRWIIVQFPAYFPEGSSKRDPNLDEKLTTDGSLSGILNWAIDGWQRLKEDGFTNAQSHDQVRETWQSWGNSVDEFISQFVERDEDADRVSTGDAYTRYKLWCQREQKDPVSQRRFTDTLKQEPVGFSNSLRVDGKVTNGYKFLDIDDEVPNVTTDDDRDDGPGKQSSL